MTTSIVYFPVMREGAVHPERQKPKSPKATSELPGLRRKAGHRGAGGGACQTGARKKPSGRGSCGPSAHTGDSTLSFNQRPRDHRHHRYGQ